MNNGQLHYKGYSGSVEYSEEDDCLHGRVIGIRPSITYEGQDVAELKKDFQDGIEDYLDDCRESGVEPERPFKGSFNIRIKPELHEKLALYAFSNEVSLNSVVEEALRSFAQTI